jgi:formamidopyrimidine-DNA glycosylase
VPELPEVETVRRGLAGSVVGRTVVAVEVIGPRTVRRQSVRRFRDRLAGRRVVDVARHGKYLLVGTDRGTLVIHLRMTGRLVLADSPQVARPAHTHAVLSLDDGRELRFVDPRTFGELFLALPGESLLAEVTGRLGPDALQGEIGPEALRRLVAGRRTTLKALLLDQRVVAGVGNIYADEICFAAGLRPDRRTDTLGPDEFARLAAGLRLVLQRAVAAGGTSLGDGSYRDLFDSPGGFQFEHAVYGRAGEPCHVCGAEVMRTRLAGRAAHFCPVCQS